MLLDEAKEILKNTGYLLEDTDDYDDADLGINTKSKRYTSFDKRMRDKHRNHNYYDYNTQLSKKIYDAPRKAAAVAIDGYSELMDFRSWPPMAIEYIGKAMNGHIAKGKVDWDKTKSITPDYASLDVITKEGYTIKVFVDEEHIELIITDPNGEKFEKSWNDPILYGRHPTWMKTWKIIQEYVPELADCYMDWLDD